MAYGNMRHVLIGRGKNGWHADMVGDDSTASSSGGTLEGYLREAPDGTPIYDADQAEYGAFASMVVGGPMVDGRLGKGEIKRFSENDKRVLFGMLPALQGEFQTIGVLAMADISSLDYVSVDVYLQMLREKVPGVRFGHVYNHQAVWEVQLT